MLSSSNVPQIEFTPEGIVLPTPQEILDGVIDDFEEAFGSDMTEGLSTPQGQLATSIAAIISNKNDQIAFLTNQFDPRFASGFFQDALGEIYFILRKPGTPTEVGVTVTGLSSTVIPAGTQVKDTTGNTYEFAEEVTIGVSGTEVGTVLNVLNGAIPCLAGTLTEIFQSINGWDTVNNVADGLLGTPIETRAEFEQRREESLEKNSRGTLEAIQGSVLELIDVLDAKVLENNTDGLVNLNGVDLVAHSIYVSVYSNAWTALLRTDVATAIFVKKNTGCNYNGATSVIITFDGQPYTVKFQEATPLEIYFEVNIKNEVGLPASIAVDIQNAIFDAFNERIGSFIEANKYYTAILSTDPQVQILTVFVGDAPSPVTINFQTIASQKPLTALNNIAVNLV